MKQTSKSGKFTWAVVFAWVFGIAGVGGVMYMLFTDEAYNGMGGAKFDSSYIVKAADESSDTNSSYGKNKKTTYSNDTKGSTNEPGSKTLVVNAPKKITERPMEKVADKPLSKPIPKQVVPIPVAVKPVLVPKPVPVIKTAPLVVKPSPIVKPTPVSKTAVVIAKPLPVTKTPVAKPIPIVKSPVAKPASVVKSIPVIAVAKYPKRATPKPEKHAADKLMNESELQQLMTNIEQKGDENGIYAKCVQLHGTSGGNNKKALEQIEVYLRSKKYTIAGRETVSAHVNGIKLSPGNNCIKVTVGSF